MYYKESLYRIYYEWWKNIDKFILFLIISLFAIGLFFSLVSTSLIASDRLNTNDYSFFFKHLSSYLINDVVCPNNMLAKYGYEILNFGE